MADLPLPSPRVTVALDPPDAVSLYGSPQMRRGAFEDPGSVYPEPRAHLEVDLAALFDALQAGLPRAQVFGAALQLDAGVGVSPKLSTVDALEGAYVHWLTLLVEASRNANLR